MALFGGRKGDEDDGLPGASKIRELWRKIEDELVAERRNYRLNQAFFTGNQYVTMAENVGAQMQVVAFRSRKDAETRMTVNGIRSRLNSVVARLIQADMQFEVQPQDLGAASHRRRRLSEHILEGERRDRQWEVTREQEVRAAWQGGTSAVAIEWDPNMPSLVVADPSNGEARRVGGCKLSALSIAEFGLEPGTREVRDATWWMQATTLTPEQAQRKFKLKEPPKPDASMYASSFGGSRRFGASRRGTEAVMVYSYYQRPVDGQPGGVVFVCGTHRESHPWPFASSDINLAVFRQTPVDGTWIGDTAMNDVRQVQVAYNDARTTMRAHVLRASNARFMVPRGALDDDDVLTNEVGELVEYTAEPGVKEPHWAQQAEVSRWLREEPGVLSAEMDEMMSTHAISKGQQLGDRNSGLALSILAEKDDTPLGPLAREQARGWAYIGRYVLMAMRHNVDQLNQMYGEQAVADGLVRDDGTPAVDPIKARFQTVTENKVPVVREWTAEDIDENPVVTVPLETVSPRSAAATKAELVSMATAFPNLGANLDMRTLARVTRTPSLDAAFMAENSDVACAQRENELMLEGIECTPDSWHEHAIHIREHNDQRNTLDYETADPEIQKLYDDHVLLHEQMAAMDLMRQAQPALPSQPLGLPPGSGPSSPSGQNTEPMMSEGVPLPPGGGAEIPSDEGAIPA